MQFKKMAHYYPCATDGEGLYLFIRGGLLDSDVWGELRTTLAPTGRATHLVELFHQIAAVQMTGRIVAAGDSLTRRFALSDPQFRTHFLSYLREVTDMYGEHLDTLYSHGVRAIRAAQETISQGLSNKLKTTAERQERPCYICGITLDFTTNNKRDSYTCEHVWPQNYGGNSIPENLLPACGDCNWKFKKDFATWAMVNVQSLIRGIDPSEDGISSIESHYRIALHYRAAQRLAIVKGTTLRDAFLTIKPWQDIRILQRQDTADFFNLANHNHEVVIE